ncbi:MAG: sigma-70 family RNA polymerase sigma factor [bacterium]|nr:sigma-70 family RNA polymerase sigma factor [bacterium]
MREADPDVELMLAFCAGDDSAFDPLFDRWGRPLLHYLERMVADSATAEELVQEAFLRVYHARERYRPEARFSTWLYRIGTNLALNELRRPRRSRPHTSTDEVPGDAGPPLRLAAEGTDPAAEFDTRRRGGRVEKALRELPERQGMAIWLTAVEGMSYAEVATALDTTEKSVKSLVHRARVALVANVDEGQTEQPEQRPSAGAREETKR